MSGPQQTFTERDPRHHTTKIKGMLDKTARHCGEDIPKITEPKAQALFETTAEVLKGFITAYHHYEKAEEPGRRRLLRTNSMGLVKVRTQMRNDMRAHRHPKVQGWLRRHVRFVFNLVKFCCGDLSDGRMRKPLGDGPIGRTYQNERGRQLRRPRK